MSDVYFDSDVQARIVATLAMSILTWQANSRQNTQRLLGVLDACQTITLSFGLSWTSVVGEARTNALGSGYDELLAGAARARNYSSRLCSRAVPGKVEE